MIDTVTSNYRLHQQIQESANVLNLSSSCIDLIFTSQPNLVIESGVYSSLHPNYQIVFNLSLLHPSLYERTVCFYKKIDPELYWMNFIG